jgi:hypothetical protein
MVFGLKKMDKRGQILTGPMGTTVAIVLGLFFIGVLVFAYSLAGSEISGATEDATAQAVINKTVEGASKFAGFSPALWIMAGVGALITIILLAVASFAMRS